MNEKNLIALRDSEIAPTTRFMATNVSKDIFECADHREFLKTYLATRKSGQGLRALARKAGFRSPGHLTMLIRGERSLTPRSAEMLAKALAFKGRRRSLLLAFSKLDTGKTECERGQARDEIIRLKSFRPEFQIAAKQYSFLAVWYYPVLYSLLQNQPERADCEYLSERLGRGVSTENVKQALHDLETLGLIAKTATGWQVQHAALATPEDVQHLAIGKYHRNSLELAGQALALPLSEREFNGLTVAIPRHLVAEVKEKMRVFRSELNEMLSREKVASDIYQLNFQLFPVTTGVEGKGS